MGSLQNQLTTISQLDELIGFATKTETVDDFGSTVDVYSTPTADIPAMVRFDSTNEQQSPADQEKFTTQIKVWVRYDATYTEFKYVYWNSQRYDIYAIEHTPRQRFMVIKARLIET